MEPVPANTDAALNAAAASDGVTPAVASDQTLASSTSPPTNVLHRLRSASSLEFDTPEPSSGRGALLDAIADFKRRKVLAIAGANK